MYTIFDYGRMTSDRRRTDSYRAALRARVTPDSAVLDIGAGPGMLTLLACQAGARRVYAVEPSGIIQVARESVAANGYADRVEFIQDLSSNVELPEKVDVIVSDVHGILPFYERSIASLIDARTRFLKPEGFMIPSRETVLVGLVSAPQEYERILDPWEHSYGLDGAAGRQRAVNSWKQWHGKPDELVVEPKVLFDIDYSAVIDVNFRGQTSWTVAQEKESHGIAAWFDCETTPGYGFSNAPGCEDHWIYKQAFFPWPQPCLLKGGDQVSIEIRAEDVGDDYAYSWNTVIISPEDLDPIKARFRQSTLISNPMSADWFSKAKSSFVPSRSEDGDIDRTILELFSTGITLEEISRRLSQQFPRRFPDPGKAFDRIAAISVRYSD
jgi:type I protein arginine methyltransferase